MKKTEADLREIREAFRPSRRVREGNPRVTIVVHLGRCGVAAGGGEILQAFRRKVREHGLGDVHVAAHGCAGRCEHEPMATIENGGPVDVRYGRLSGERVDRIVEEHVKNGRVVEEYRIP